VAQVAELRAIADYRKSLVNFERVQEAGGGALFALTGASTATGSRTGAPPANTQTQGGP
jgi:hypothetical protein